MRDECFSVAFRLLEEVGFQVPHEGFLNAIRGRDGVRIAGDRAYFPRRLIEANWERIAEKGRREHARKPRPAEPWEVTTGGFSMCVIDAQTDAIRPATQEDLRQLIRLKDSFGVSGHYPVMPQDLPPLMRAIACYKICYESSDRTKPFDYLDVRQTPYIYEMTRLMGKPFTITLCVPQTMRIDEKDIEILLRFHPRIEAGEEIDFQVLDYAMLGILKPITATGCVALCLAHGLAVHMLLRLFDPRIEVPLRILAGLPVDLRHACWAFGSPRTHLYDFLNAMAYPFLLGIEPEEYTPESALLATSSSAIDEQAALEKMGTAMMAALQGARSFSYAGNLCVDDLFSGVQFVIDLEIVRYIRETLSAFDPAPEVFDTGGLYDLLKDVSTGKELFISHPDTVSKVARILPSSDLLHREKLRSWLDHRKTLADRAREECVKRMREGGPGFRLPAEKQAELDAIYRRAENDLAE